MNYRFQYGSYGLREVADGWAVVDIRTGVIQHVWNTRHAAVSAARDLATAETEAKHGAALRLKS